MDITPWRKNVFDAWLRLGGVSTGQKDFNAPDPRQAYADRSEGKALDFIDEPRPTEEIDFLHLARVFFSARCIAAAGQASATRVREAPEVIINFLKYINRHDVLPEHRADIDATIRFSERAKVELGVAKEFSLLVPGLFNESLSTLYHGYYHSLHDSSNNWHQSTTTTEGGISNQVMDTARARAIIRASGIQKVFLSGGDAEAGDGSIRPRRHIVGMPVTVDSILDCPFTDSLKSVVLRPWTDMEGLEPEDQFETDVASLRVLVEPKLCDWLPPNSHFEADFYQLTDTLWFFDTVSRVLPSFYYEYGDEHDL